MTGNKVGGFIVLGLLGGVALWAWRTSRDTAQQDSVLGVLADILDSLGDAVPGNFLPTERKKTNEGVAAADLAKIATFSGPSPIDAAGLVNVDPSNPVLGGLFPGADAVVVDNQGRGFVLAPNAGGGQVLVPTAALVDALGKGNSVTVAQPGGGVVTYTDYDANKAGALSALSPQQVSLVPDFVKKALGLL